ncbi:GIY-YIG nuclease family protein [Alterisphingorhabdus coralli]|uniref:GIY-YIG nuclease family protein n=1 Tax=Alterisphingorhabdus coralli TaxID=3071408 RepID=A0AA97F7N3_9SPHN|nr:GIY-YIG nuclease family protein [Parasphingorhabdus sp. SCSIO 66989]WOE74976.1 GIY-YIG nuclease family protein [Parasphingorhabdus sp. SCSIO 66989]
MANRYRGRMYVGVTSHIARRSFQHRSSSGSEYCRKHGLNRLVYAEWHDEIHDAIVREKRLKKWERPWKFRLIEEQNPDWRDLFDDLNK